MPCDKVSFVYWPAMPTSLYTVTIDCADPARLADFWSEVLGYKRAYQEPDEIAIEAPDESGPALLFGKGTDPKVVKNRIHFDLVPDDQGAEVERILALGATRVDIGQGRDDQVTWVVLADPEGNEFCVLTPRKGRPR
jgi:predicted enzyme related to lactoylglutathione lyase